ncbi:hypothetical protein V8G54_027412 [Vigna mungo]|uniref:RING-type domain-containing protein n=1 Tax=Vigna mungo TaxID=3915 RepID=A0AAQ3N1C6_VIGMU
MALLVVVEIVVIIIPSKLLHHTQVQVPHESNINTSIRIVRVQVVVSGHCTADSTVDSLKVQVELHPEDCIDLWLCSHKTCPVCRRDLDSPPDDQPLKLGDVVVSSANVEIRVDVREEEGLDCGQQQQHEQQEEQTEPERSRGLRQEHEMVNVHEEQMFVRSHSTRNSIVMIRQEGDDEGKNDDDKYTLRLPEHVLRVNSKHNSTRSCASFKDMTKLDAPLPCSNCGFVQPPSPSCSSSPTHTQRP